MFYLIRSASKLFFFLLLCCITLLCNTDGVSAAISIVDFDVQSSATSVRGGYYFEFVSTDPLNTDGSPGGLDKVRFTFPEGFYIASPLVEASGVNIWGTTGVSSGENWISTGIYLSTTGQPLPASTPVQFTLANIHNTVSPGTYTVLVELLDNNDVILDSTTQDINLSADLLIDDIAISNTSPGAGNVSYDITITPTTNFQSPFLGIVFPKGTNLTNVTSGDIVLNTSDPTHNPSITSISLETQYDNYLILALNSSGPPVSGSISIRVNNVINPPTEPYSPIGIGLYETWTNYPDLYTRWSSLHTPLEGGYWTFTTAGGISQEHVQLSNTVHSAQNVNYTISFDINDDLTLEAGDEIRLIFPNSIDLSAVQESDVSISAGTVVKDFITIHGQTLHLRIASGTHSDGRVEIEIAGVTNPSNQAGIYLLEIELYDVAAQLKGQGSASFTTGSFVQVTALVSEALILTLSNNAVTLSVDPAVNNGIDRSQYTQLNVYSNSPGGYMLSALLDGAQLTHTDGLGAISSGIGDGYFSYHATNAPYDNNYIYTGDRAFSDTSNELRDGNNNILGHTTVADPIQHTIYYDLDINFLTPAGTYTGLVYYTVTASF